MGKRNRRHKKRPQTDEERKNNPLTGYKNLDMFKMSKPILEFYNVR